MDTETAAEEEAVQTVASGIINFSRWAETHASRLEYDGERGTVIRLASARAEQEGQEGNDDHGDHGDGDIAQYVRDALRVEIGVHDALSHLLRVLSAPAEPQQRRQPEEEEVVVEEVEAEEEEETRPEGGSDRYAVCDGHDDHDDAALCRRTLLPAYQRVRAYALPHCDQVNAALAAHTVHTLRACMGALHESPRAIHALDHWWRRWWQQQQRQRQQQQQQPCRRGDHACSHGVAPAPPSPPCSHNLARDAPAPCHPPHDDRDVAALPRLPLLHPLHHVRAARAYVTRLHQSLMTKRTSSGVGALRRVRASLSYATRLAERARAACEMARALIEERRQFAQRCCGGDDCCYDALAIERDAAVDDDDEGGGDDEEAAAAQQRAWETAECTVLDQVNEALSYLALLRGDYAEVFGASARGGGGENGKGASVYAREAMRHAGSLAHWIE